MEYPAGRPKEAILSRMLCVCCSTAILAAMALSWTASPALANGNFSHVWVATDALNYLEDGELKELMTRPESWNIIRNGAMFPDGGYAVSDGYGEISHWEPFHLAYLEWIRANFESPWSVEAAEHIAFLMGMAAHGLTDQIYDGMYLQRHQFYDEHGSEATLIGVDGATDACYAVTQGEMELPEQWVPAAVLAPLYAEVAGHNVVAKTIELGQSIVVVAIMAANDAINNPSAIDEYMDLYPWACSHQDDPTVPGSPPTTGRAVAMHWQALWARLHGEEATGRPLSGTYFSGGTPYDQPTDASTPESWVSFVMPFGLDTGSVNNDTVVVTDLDGEVYPVNLHVYYGSNSHLVNVKPKENWPVDTEFTVTISPAVASWEGQLLAQAQTFTFATFSEPVVVAEEYTVEEVVSMDIQELDVSDLTGDALPETSGASGGCSAQSPGSGLGQILMLLLLLAAVRIGFGQWHSGGHGSGSRFVGERL